MIEVKLEMYAVALFVLMMVEVLSIIVILLKLRNSDVPLGMVKTYTLYFISGVCGWILNGLSNASEKYISLAAGGFFYVLCGYLLLIAVSRGRCHPLVRHLVLFFSVAAVLMGVMEKSTANQILILSVFGFFVYLPTTYFSLKNTLRDRNLGDAMITFAVLASVIISLVQIYLITVLGDPSLAHSFALINSSAGYLLVGIGFVASMLFREHQLLMSQAIKDPLTNLLNRRGMEYAVNIIVPRAYQKKSCVSAIALDIDHFKNVNDSYGHDGGDEVLKSFAKLLELNHRDDDISCRLGGEEFVVIVPWTDSARAEQMAEILRQKVEKLQIEFNDSVISVTSSFGVATTCSEVDIETLLQQADKALYAAKESGRNKVCIYDSLKHD